MGKKKVAAEPYISSRLIRPSGPIDSPGLLVGEAGGETEHRQQRPFCGKAGHVLNTYLKAAGIARPDIRVTNVYNAWTGPGNPDPTPEQIRSSEWYLVQEILTLRPRLIGTLGRVAGLWFFPNNPALEVVHGIPQAFSICASCGATGHGTVYSGSYSGVPQVQDQGRGQLLGVAGREGQRRLWHRKSLRPTNQGSRFDANAVDRRGMSPQVGTRSPLRESALHSPQARRVRDERGERATSVSKTQVLSKRSSTSEVQLTMDWEDGQSPSSSLSGVSSGSGTSATVTKRPAPRLEPEEPRAISGSFKRSVQNRRSVSREEEAGLEAVSSSPQGLDQCCPTPDIFETTVVCCIHPAAGFYNPALAAHCQEDLFRFALYLRHPVDPTLAPKIQVQEIEREPDEIDGAAVDTEGLEDNPWGLSWSADGRTTNVHISKRLKKTRLTGRITFQNALHDLRVLRAMGIDTSELDYDDTMVMLYCLQLEAQGLKPAAYRHLGLKMQDFDDVVRPHFNRVALDFLRRAAELDYPKPKGELVRDMAKRRWKFTKPWDAGRRVKSILTSWSQGETEPGEDGPPKLEKKWDKISEGMREQIERAVGAEFPSFSIFHVDREQAVQYSGIDAAATALLKPVLLDQLKKKDLLKVYEMDRRYLPLIDKMQETGMRVDVNELGELEDHLEVIRLKAKDEIQQIVGDKWFNPGSDDQVGAWLYKVRGIPVLKYTDGGEGSTSAVTLKMIQGYHGADNPDVMAFTTKVREYREADKYLGTFVRPIFIALQRDKHGNWRLHPNFKVTRVVSGRNSSEDPNVMALPTRTALGLRIRKCFVAGEGYVIVSVDASQIELRMGANFCRDRTMLNAFVNDEDLHALTASIIFGVSLESFTKPKDEIEKKLRKQQRYVAKTINFAVFYGISARALLEQLYKADIFSFTLEDCQRFINEWFRVYSSVPLWQKRLWAQAEKDGWVRDFWGRICYIPNLRVGDDKMREAARRLAGNMPIQGTARGLVKRAETRCHDYFTDTGMYHDDIVRPWLDLHDEIDLEVREDHAQEIARDVTRFFGADQSMFRVPIKAEAGVGKSWAEAKA